MASRLGWFVLGGLTVVVLFCAGAYLFISGGGVPMATSAPPLPLEKTVARLALRANVKSSLALNNPIPADEANLMAGARVYREQCVVCHGAPGVEHTPIAKGMFPDPPELFEMRDMVTDDPDGETYWKVTNGIRLTGMPAFGKTLSDTQRWQLTTLLKQADKLPPAVQTAMRQP
jgi:mono/diheme cytochrome c family protein